ncbi:MAG TPA: efflux transporter outer membrane subunit [Kofleriaceae bacterium]|nr:efflux transporter outer membrane subunit [Kofleriaceae bacterium]
MKRRSLCAWALVPQIALGACVVGPSYQVPPAPTPTSARYKEAGTWKVASPGDALPRGPWWTMFRQPELDALQAHLNVNNQTIAAAFENYLAARALIRAAEAQYYPTIVFQPSTSRGRSPGVTGANPSAVTGSSATTGGGIPGPFEAYVLAGQGSWVPDLFGRVRNNVRGRRYNAQASAADLESTRLAAQASLTATYFQLRGQDALIELLDKTVTANAEIASITRTRYEAGLENESVVVQAELTLQAARVQATNAGVLRGEYEHAIAALIGVPPTDFSMPHRALLATPPRIPLGAPSHLLERRPDIASAERQMAAANAAVGVGYAAYFPVITLSGTAGFATSTLSTLFHWPSRLWSTGLSLAQTIFDGGERRANLDQLYALYFATVAKYRQTVLTAFQQVEDNLTQTRILVDVIEQQRTAVALAQRGFDLQRVRYETGLDPYINLMVQQTALLSAQQQLVSFQVQQMLATVQLVQALGGGWDRSLLPKE